MVGFMARCCERYDTEHAQPMRLFMSLYSVEHISRISRVLQMHRGHALLLGSTGVGRRSLAHIAAYVGRSKLSEVHPPVYGNMGEDDAAWRGHLKRLVRICGLGLAPNMAILVRDSVLTAARMQDVCCVLGGTDIPGLFSSDETQALVAEMEERGLVEKSEMKRPAQELYAQLLQTAYDSMHLIICMDPYASKMRDVMASYPSLLSRCTVDWFQDWPEETLQQMAEQHLPSLFAPELGRTMMRACSGMQQVALETARVRGGGCLLPAACCLLPAAYVLA
jgi:dynein heavy chain